MPLILSRHEHMNSYSRRRRRCSMGSQQSHASSTQPWTVWPFWRTLATARGQDTTDTQATAMSRTSSDCSSFSNLSQTLSPDRESRQQTGSCSYTAELNNCWYEEENWGQFVDPARAEEEIVRHSKILSRTSLPSRSCVACS
jgi:hypothetical protein